MWGPYTNVSSLYASHISTPTIVHPSHSNVTKLRATNILGLYHDEAVQQETLGPDDLISFQIIMATVVCLGSVFSLIFHIAVKETSQPAALGDSATASHRYNNTRCVVISIVIIYTLFTQRTQ